MDTNAKASSFAATYGSFTLHFDLAQNYVQPDDTPWTLVLDSNTEAGWGGFDAESAIDFADTELRDDRVGSST